eukprot:752438-Hanusia_phi.AAC.1
MMRVRRHQSRLSSPRQQAPRPPAGSPIQVKRNTQLGNVLSEWSRRSAASWGMQLKPNEPESQVRSTRLARAKPVDELGRRRL